MKLRLAENSVRLRVGKADLNTLRESYVINEMISFGAHQVLIYQLVTGDFKEVNISFQNGELSIQLPIALSEQWMNSDEVGIEKTIVYDDGHQVHLLIEKDFPCKNTPSNKRSDTFEELMPPDRSKC